MQSHNQASSPTLLILLRVIIVVLVVGVAMFLGMLLFFGFGPKTGSPILGNFLTYSAMFVGLVAVGVNAALSMLASKSVPGTDSGRGVVTFALSKICGGIAFAFAAFFASAAMMLEHSLSSLILAIVMIIGIATRFPLAAYSTRRSSDTA